MKVISTGALALCLVFLLVTATSILFGGCKNECKTTAHQKYSTEYFYDPDTALCWVKVNKEEARPVECTGAVKAKAHTMQ